jgi:KID repeat protein
MDDNFFTEKELKSANRGSIAPVVVVIFVIIALLGLAFFGGKYYLASRNNIKIFMNDYFNKLEDNIGKNNSTSGSLSLNVNGDTTDKEEKIFKILNNLDFSMNYGIDTKENITNIDISTNYYGDKLININTYIEDNNIYLSSSDLYSKYIKIENKKEDNSEKKSMTNDDYKVIINSISTAVSESLKEEYFTKNWVKLDGKSVNKVELLLNNNNIKIINENIINNLKNNNNFIDSFGKLIGKKTMEVKELLDKEIKEVNSNEYSDIKISLYTKITKFVKLEITSGEDKIVVKSNDKGYSFEIVDSEDNNTYNGTIEINNNSDSTTYNVNVKDSNNLEIKINNTINKTTKIEKKDVSNSILLEDITEKEYEDIINKISNNKAFNKIYEDISNSNIEIGDIA